MSIIDPWGQTFDDDERINLGSFEDFYRGLFTIEKVGRRNYEAREEILAYTFDRLENGDRTFLCAPPNLEELVSTLKRMPTDKAPGLDGITLETLRACWSLIGADVLAMVLTFWETRIIAYKISDGIIKLILKSVAK